MRPYNPEYLNLSCCDITPEGCLDVVRALSVMKNLKVLKIAENELGGAVAVERA